MENVLVYSFLIFILSSFLGYIIEVLWVYIHSKKLVNRGFFCGPIIPIYGLGGLLMLYTLFRYYNDPLVVFVFGIILSSSLEYFLSFILEKIFHNKWWDYSNYKYNLNGRICLKNSIYFGVLSLVTIYLFTPLFKMLFDILSFNTWKIIAIILFILFILDTIYSIYVAYNLRNTIIVVEDLKNDKIAMIPVMFNKKMKEISSKLKYSKRLLNAFPNLEKKNHKGYELMKKLKLDEKKNKYK